MKKLLLLALALSLPLAQLARADNNDQDKKKKHKRPVGAETQKAAPDQHRLTGGQPARSQSRHAVAQQRPTTMTPGRRQAVTSQADVARKVQPGKNSPAVTAPNRVKRNFDRNSFAVAKTRVVTVRQDRNWWRTHYRTRFVLFGGGSYYWDSGYWYPAYGYSPIYSTYAYNEPIYGYNDLAPGQVIENVQLALRDQGYYRGSIDGLIGPETRGALASYQRDHGLLVTSAIDEPTLATLGLA